MARNPPVVINLWAPPGVGKSSNMAAIFNALKYRGAKVEMAPEVAKLFSYTQHRVALADPFYVTAMQEFQVFALRDHVDYIISDSPCGISMLHCEWKDRNALAHLCRHLRSRYCNLDVRLHRDEQRPYQTYGRHHTERQSRKLEAHLDNVFMQLGVTAYERIADDAAANDIIQYVDKAVVL